MNIEELKKQTGMSDAELSNYVIERVNEGATEEQIINELLAKGSEKKYLKDSYPEISEQLIQERKDRLSGKEGWNAPWPDYFKKSTFPSWRSHTEQPGNSTPTDNGWTDLKKAFTPNKAIDPMWQLGVIEDAFGDSSKFNLWNQNVQAQKQRDAQEAYNLMMKELDKAQTEKEKYIADTKAETEKKLAEAKASKEEDAKNLDIFLQTMDKLNTGRELNTTEKSILKVAFNKMSAKNQAEYANVYDSLMGSKPKESDIVDTDVVTEEPTLDKSKYATPAEQSKYKTYVSEQEAAISAMPNGAQKQAAMKELNKYKDTNGKKVEGGLGKRYTPNDITKAAAAAKPKEYGIGDTWSGVYKDAPKIRGSLRWVRTGNKDRYNQDIYEVRAK